MIFKASIMLAVLVLFAAVAFGWRSWLQWRRTGSAGFRGLSGHVGSAEWSGGALLIVALLLAVAAPVVTLLGILDAWALPTAASFVGAALVATGFIGTIAAQLSMGDSWRIGVNPAERTALVSRGLFRVSRNPIFTSMLALLLGQALLLLSALSALAFLTALAGLEIQVRLVEEPYLLQVHRESYVRYAAQVGRFLPAMGRLKPRS